MKIKTLQVDACLSIESNGTINTHVYMGEGSCEPVVEDGEPLTDLIDSLLEAYVVPGTNKIADYHYDECDELVKQLKHAVKYAKKRIKELKD